MYSGELYLALVQSTKARAKLVRVDPSHALSMPGVVDYISHVDVPGKNSWGFSKDETIFAAEEVNLCTQFGHCVCVLGCMLAA